MKRVLGALALLVVVLIVVWGYRTVKDALLAPVPLVQGFAGPYDFALGQVATAGKQQEERVALTKALDAAGIKVDASAVMLMEDGGARIRSGVLLRKPDVARSRKVHGNFRVMSLPAQKGWIAQTSGTGAGAVSVGMTMARTMSSLMGKATALSWTSYLLVVRLGGETSEAAIVPAPR